MPVLTLLLSAPLGTSLQVYRVQDCARVQDAWVSIQRRRVVCVAVESIFFSRVPRRACVVRSMGDGSSRERTRRSMTQTRGTEATLGYCCTDSCTSVAHRIDLPALLFSPLAKSAAPQHYCCCTSFWRRWQNIVCRCVFHLSLSSVSSVLRLVLLPVSPALSFSLPQTHACTPFNALAGTTILLHN